MNKTKTIIINYNRLALLQQMVDWCIKNDLEPIILDNCSSYEPLIEYYNTKLCQILKMEQNYGKNVIWTNDILNKLNIHNERYIITDSDLDFKNIPADFLQVLNAGLDKYSSYGKCGFSLEINDLPDTPLGNQARKYEGSYWKHQLDQMYFSADIDTTFALYRENNNTFSYNALRTNRPYTAKHVLWYYKDMNDMPDDEKYYLQTVAGHTGYWCHEIKRINSK